MTFPRRSTEDAMSQQPESQYLQTHQYASGSTRLQQPTAWTLPVSEENVIGQPEVSPASHVFPEGEFVPPGFFANVRPDLFALPKSQEVWKYHMRREAQMVLPFIYLGPWVCLKDREWLEREGFTFLLAVRDKRLAHARLVSGERAAADLGIEVDAVDTVDPQELITALPRAIRRINDHISAPGTPTSGNSPHRKILLFCETGNGQSALVLVAYLMVMFNLDFAHALNVTHLRRFCVDIDEPSRQILLSFESILTAKRDVERARRAAHLNPSLGAPFGTTSRKRDYVHYDMNGDMDVDEDGDSILSRKPLAPFQDRWQ